MKRLAFLLLLLSISFSGFAQIETTNSSKKQINLVMEQWHAAAAQADFDTYFSLMTPDGVFIGTDATENWQNEEFKDFSKPYFDKGKAWSFSSLERNIYISETNNIAWFDELLDTQMGICRGSGILKNNDGKWQIAHYVLSIAIPNDNVTEVTQLKKEFDTALARKLKE
ncbi:nuclear transport factor 2 family protein [Gillisia sp. M10.2A]|uniref:Nuclear transport factor 2 family protein n=1 Tax=Gillisia lutea TaxID=2909668 RepID=A0ABS9EEW4_9FLAO|nr:nuclear transport factor 2 family protein [Gillisia lutea]MCF4100320.1 nuclear transport factor 2 family protein [Gillisia lutea]